jgi:hypothetical protein
MPPLHLTAAVRDAPARPQIRAIRPVRPDLLDQTTPWRSGNCLGARVRYR